MLLSSIDGKRYKAEGNFQAERNLIQLHGMADSYLTLISDFNGYLNPEYPIISTFTLPTLIGLSILSGI